VLSRFSLVVIVVVGNNLRRRLTHVDNFVQNIAFAKSFVTEKCFSEKFSSGEIVSKFSLKSLPSRSAKIHLEAEVLKRQV